MTVPSKNFTIIADSAIDADSPITADLMEDFRDNDIHLEEWLGLSYTAAQNHDHDGANSSIINIAGSLSFYEEQTTFNTQSSSWSVSTGSLGFTPALCHIRWGWASSAVYTVDQYHGWGWAWGTGAGDQFGISGAYPYILSTLYAPLGFAYDTDNIMGYDSGIAVVNFHTWLTSFSTEQASVSAFGSGGITISTSSGAWGINWPNCTIVFFVWGS